MRTDSGSQETNLKNDPNKRNTNPSDLETSGKSSTGLSTTPSSRSQLITEAGRTSIANGVVAKIAGLSAREIPGVQSMGTGASRRMGQLKSFMPGTGSNAGSTASQGVSVEVGEQETAIDLDIVTWYGQSIVDVTNAVRRNVTERIESMTGLKVVEVNINVDDVFVEGEQEEVKEPRVQ